MGFFSTCTPRVWFTTEITAEAVEILRAGENFYMLKVKIYLSTHSYDGMVEIISVQYWTKEVSQIMYF